MESVPVLGTVLTHSLVNPAAQLHASSSFGMWILSVAAGVWRPPPTRPRVGDASQMALPLAEEYEVASCADNGSIVEKRKLLR